MESEGCDGMGQESQVVGSKKEGICPNWSGSPRFVNNACNLFFLTPFVMFQAWEPIVSHKQAGPSLQGSSSLLARQQLSTSLKHFFFPFKYSPLLSLRILSPRSPQYWRGLPSTDVLPPVRRRAGPAWRPQGDVWRVRWRQDGGRGGRPDLRGEVKSSISDTSISVRPSFVRQAHGNPAPPPWFWNRVDCVDCRL